MFFSTIAPSAGASEGQIYTGAYSDEWAASADLSSFGQSSGVPLTFGGTFNHPLEGSDNTGFILEQVWSAGATPVVNLEVAVSSATIATGRYDNELRQWAFGVEQWLSLGEERSLLIAPMAEMNGSWVPWGMDPETYPAAFRRVVEMFRSMGMDETQVRWIFAPNSVSSWPYGLTSYWPGSDVVDIVGFSAYNFGGEPEDWASAHDSLFTASQLLRVVARDKPFLITQIGSAPDGGEKDGWIIEMFDFIENDPNMIGFVYFNFDKEANWKVWENGQVVDGWVDAVSTRATSYQFPLTEWFQPGPLPLSVVNQQDSAASSTSGIAVSGGSVAAPASGITPSGGSVAPWRPSEGVRPAFTGRYALALLARDLIADVGLHPE